MTVKLRPHQVDALKRMSNGKILFGAPGSGKSLTAIAYYLEKEAPKDLYIITTATKRDSLEWMGDAAKYGVGIEVGATVAGVMHIDSWNSIEKYVDVEGAFFIFDEQRLVGSGAWVKAFYTIAKKNNWIILSGTPGDVWSDYIPVFVANGFYEGKSDFAQKHIVYNRYAKFPKIDRYVNQGVLLRRRQQVLVHMPFDRHTNRHIEYVQASYDEELFKKVHKDRWNVFTDKPVKEASEWFTAMRRVVNSDISRVGETLIVFEKNPRLIIFYNFDYELEMLRVMCNALGVTYAERNGHNHDDVPTGERWIYLVQYAAGAEAWNCTVTNAILFWSLNYSYKVNEQAQGRIDRLNTSYIDLYYYYLVSDSLIDKSILSALKSKKSFNESSFA